MSKNLKNKQKLVNNSNIAKLNNYHLFCIKVSVINSVIFAALTVYYLILSIFNININETIKIINTIVGIISIAIATSSLVCFIILLIWQIKAKTEEKKEINYILNALFLVVMGVLFIIMR